VTTAAPRWNPADVIDAEIVSEEIVSEEKLWS
jgi:hypothetical protein